MEDIYVKEGQVALVDNCNRFVYEVFVFVQHKNIFSTANHKYFSSEKEIKNIVSIYQHDEYIQTCCDLYSAPLKWLIENDFTLYVKPEKKKRIYKKKVNEEHNGI
jgi:hypothetical protein